MPVDLLVNSNTTLLGVVIHNLIDNAVKAKMANHIHIYSAKINDAAHLIVADEGPGMPEKLVHWLNAESEGAMLFVPSEYNGLGLLMIREITKMLNIKLLVQNQPTTAVHLIFRNADC